MTVPMRPEPDELVETDWGRWVHDSLLQNTIDHASIANLVAKASRGVILSQAQASGVSFNTGAHFDGGTTSFESGRDYMLRYSAPDVSLSVGGTPTWQLTPRVGSFDLDQWRQIPQYYAGVTGQWFSTVFSTSAGSKNVRVNFTRITGSGNIVMSPLGAAPAMRLEILDLGASGSW